MSALSVVLAVNPYEAAILRRALAETGLEVRVAEGGEGALEEVAAQSPLALVIGTGLYHADAGELLHAVRQAGHGLPVFLVSDQEGAEAARDLGATQLFTRPIDVHALVDAIERVAVAAERMRGDDAVELDSSELVEITGDGVPRASLALQDSPSRLAAQPGDVEMVAEPDDTPLLAHIVAPPPLPPANLDDGWFAPPLVPARPSLMQDEIPTGPVRSPPPAAEMFAAPVRVPTEVVEPPARVPTEVVAPARQTRSFLRADDALADAAGLDLSLLARDLPAAPEPIVPEPAAPAAEQPRRASGPRSSISMKLDDELSAAERRLFPGAAPTPGPVLPYEDALGDIDLDALGVDTIPGLGPDMLESLERPLEMAAPLVERVPGVPVTPANTTTEEGALDQVDVAVLVARLHRAGFSGRLRLANGETEKALYFDAGELVFAASNAPYDRIAEMLFREGKLSVEQTSRVRQSNGASDPGRRGAAQLVELGLLRPQEIFAVVRRQVEEIFYSCFAWDRGRYSTDATEPPAEDRLRLSAALPAMVVEGIRRKYGFERLYAHVGPSDVVLSPTGWLQGALGECELRPGERRVAVLFDGARTLSEVGRAAAELSGPLITEAALYGVAWALMAVGALESPRRKSDPAAPRLLEREISGPAERLADPEIERERLLAKRGQIAEGDYFAILGVDRNASTYEIHRAFERLSADFAPDRFPEPLRVDMGDVLGEIREVLDEAHRVLADEEVRAAYRSHLVD